MKEKNTIYVVFKTHFDIGFTELVSDLIKRWDTKMFPDLIKVCEATQELGKDHKYVWTMPSWPLFRYLNKFASSEETVNKAKSLIANKQIEWHMLPFTTHTEFCGLEEYIRGLYFSKKLSEEFGRWPITAKMTDVVGHTWILPSLLSKAGVKFLHLGPNQAFKLPEVPQLFFWEGPDGDRVLVFYNKAGGYGSSLLPPKDWKYPVWLALMQTNDNLGPQGPEDIGYILEAVEEEAPGTKVIIGSMDDFYNELSKYNMDDIPVVRGDIADLWIHGTGTLPNEVGKLRNLRHTLTDTEKALSLGILGGLFDKSNIQRSKNNIDNAYENSILFGEHTWGLNTFNVEYMKYERNYKKNDLRKNGDLEKYEASWDEHRKYYLDAQTEVDEVKPDILNALASSVNVEGDRLTIFSGLGWKRSAWVNIDSFKEQVNGKILFDITSNENLETAHFDGKLHVYANDLPAFGYKTIVFKENSYNPAKKAGVIYDVEHGVFENWWYRIVVDPATGTIKSLKDKSTGHEWVGKYDEHGFAQYQYDVYSGEEATKFLVDSSVRYYDWHVCGLVRKDYYEPEHICSVPEKFTVEVIAGEKSATIIMKSKISDNSVIKYGNVNNLVTEITIYADQPFIDLQYYLKDKEKTFCVESGHFVFPINLKNSQVNINKLGSVINPAVDIIEGGNHALYCCENWVDITDGEKGMAVIPYDTQLFSIGSSGIVNFRRTYVKEEPILLFNAFNNSYGCNFPQWMDGDYSFRYRLIPHLGDWKQGNVAKLAFESVTPPLVGFSNGYNEKNKLPICHELIKELDGMEIVTLKQAENCDGFILRLRDISGEKHSVKLSFDHNFESISRCDLLERILDNPFEQKNDIQFETKPFEIHSFYLK
jgi:alpha-mannosidase